MHLGMLIILRYMASTGPSGSGDFLLLDNTDFLLLDGSNFLLFMG